MWSQQTVTTPSRFDHVWGSSNLWSQILSSSYRDAYCYISLSLGSIFYLSGILVIKGFPKIQDGGRKLWLKLFAAAASEHEANERGCSLTGIRIHHRGFKSLLLIKRKELWSAVSSKAQGIVVMRKWNKVRCTVLCDEEFVKKPWRYWNIRILRYYRKSW